MRGAMKRAPAAPDFLQILSPLFSPISANTCEVSKRLIKRCRTLYKRVRVHHVRHDTGGAHNSMHRRLTEL